MSKENRDKPRRAVLWSGQLKFGDHSFDCQIWNISFGGAKVNVGLPFAEGTEVTLTLEGKGQFTGKVMWQSDKNLGIKFDSGDDEMRKAFGKEAIVSLGLDDNKLTHEK
jgi:hypothetical protein